MSLYRQTEKQTDRQIGSLSETSTNTKTKHQSNKSRGDWMDGELE